jgi:hypothetical protein
MNKITSRSSFKIIGFTAIGLIVISTGLLANHHGGKHQRGPLVIDEVVERMKSHGSKQFLAADINQDGLISLAEFEQHKPRQGLKGRNHPASTNEGAASQENQHPRQGGKMRGHRGAMGRFMFAGVDRKDMRAQVELEMFALLDADKDGTISDAEYKAANKRENKHLARKRVMFKLLDTNADGRLAQEEMPNSEKILRALDTNSDGVVDRAEMSKLREQRKAAQRAS